LELAGLAGSISPPRTQHHQLNGCSFLVSDTGARAGGDRWMAGLISPANFHQPNRLHVGTKWIPVKYISFIKFAMI